MKKLYIKILGGFVISFLLISAIATTIDDFFLPGSQPGQSGTFNDPNQCANCHGGYDESIEPFFTWKGSMMAQAMRDPLYLASMTIANQDAVDSGDLCIRCHSPSGWLEERSTPTDGSALNAMDMENGVQCHFCHKLIDPKSTSAEEPYMLTLTDIPPQSGNGMFVVDSDNNSRRGPYDDANPNSHTAIYSPFHSESDLCATCHDVSNPAFVKAPDGTYQPNTFGERSPSFDTYDMFPVERTYSEWTMSDYANGGVSGTVFGGNKSNVSSCQDCHMKDVTGKGTNKQNSPIRNDLAVHDLTGGNTFVPKLLMELYPDPVNVAALAAGIIRAEGMLKNAATMNLNVESNGSGFEAYVEIINETGHKLPSGYPEGRRMWINISAYDIADNLIFESGAYDSGTGILDMTDAKIYEAKLGMSQAVADAASDGTKTYTAGESFHFVLNSIVVKDNRIPPRGFTNANFEAIQAAPVGYTYADGAYSDITEYYLPEDAYRINVKLLYQTTSKEYIEFLRDENRTNDLGQELYDRWAANGKSAPVVMNEAEVFTDALGVIESNITQQLKIYPNPANDLVNIKFSKYDSSKVTIEAFNLNGAKMETLYNGILKSNNGEFQWKTAHIPAGIYILKINYKDRVESKLVIIK
jgi:hypothetical protein